MISVRRHGLSAIVLVAFTALAAGSKQTSTASKADSGPRAPTPGRTAIAEYMKQLGVAYTALASIEKTNAPDVPCNGPSMDARAKDGWEVHGSIHVVHLPYVHAGFMARFASGKRADFVDVEKDPWAWATSSSLRSHFKTHPDAHEEWELGSTVLFVEESRKRRYHIVIWPTAGGASRMASYEKEKKVFVPGTFVGRVAVVDVVDGSIACHARVRATSSDEVRYRTGGRGIGKLLDTQPEEAVSEDFQNAMKKQITAFVPKPFETEVGMGTLF